MARFSYNQILKMAKTGAKYPAVDFKCRRCGKCCCQFGITLSISDMNREPRLWDVAVPIQNVGNPKTRAFMAEKKHPWVIGGKEKRGDPCVFLAGTDCLIYETRPLICRDYPENGGKCIGEC